MSAALVSRSWLLELDMLGRPTLTNRAHNMHHHAVSADRRRWREAGALLARAQRIPALERIAVDCWGRYPGGNLPDPDAVAPSLKGVLDGLVDAGVIPDDDGSHVAWVRYLAPVVDRSRLVALMVRVGEVAE